MLSPSTAPPWNRQTKPGRQQAATGGKGLYDAKAARARNRGSRPTLNKATPPDFTIALLEIDICRSSDRCRLLPPLPPIAARLLPLKLRSTDRQADCQGTRLDGIADVRQLTSEDLLRVLGHRATQNLLVDRVDEPVGVSRSTDGVERHRHALELARRQRDRGIHPIEQRAAVHPRRFPLRIPVGSDVEI